jgi:hypothetical protein
VVLTAPANERQMMPLTATAAIYFGTLPSGPCPGCGGAWWGVSVLSGGPNPLALPPLRVAEPRCRARWACVGAAGSRPECDLYRLRIAATGPYACNERQPFQRNGTPRRGRRDRGAQPRASVDRITARYSHPRPTCQDFAPTTRQPWHPLKVLRPLWRGGRFFL